MADRHDTRFHTGAARVGPDWHAYPRANTDLQFVSKLYDVGFGVQALGPRITSPVHLRGKRIAAPPRPSAVRLLTEMLLRDAWDVLHDVKLVDMSAADALRAMIAGDVDAMTWNLVAPTPDGPRPMLPSPASAHYIAISESNLGRINAPHALDLELIDLLPGAPALLCFSQALAAWDGTPTSAITAVLHCIEREGPAYPGLPDTPGDMARWPALQGSQTHPAALAFCAAHGVSIS